MGEEHTGLNTARPDSGAYKGTTQLSLPSGCLSYTRGKESCPIFFDWARGCLFLEQISTPAQICEVTTDEGTSFIRDTLLFHL